MLNGHQSSACQKAFDGRGAHLGSNQKALLETGRKQRKSKTFSAEDLYKKQYRFHHYKYY